MWRRSVSTKGLWHHGPQRTLVLQPFPVAQPMPWSFPIPRWPTVPMPWAPANDVDLPPALVGESVWDRDSCARTEAAWLRQLTAAELAPLSLAAERVLHASEGAGAAGPLNLQAVEKEALKLMGTATSTCTEDILEMTLRGRGFSVLKGMPVAEWGRAKSGAAFLLFSRLLGPLRMQNASGHILGHVRDLGLSSKDPETRVYQTSERQTFHTDSSDIVGLLCLQPAKSGGTSSMVSASRIFNEIRRQRPDLLQLLLQPIATDRRGDIPPGGKPFFMIPVFSWYQGFLSVQYQRQYIDSAQRFSEAPRLTAAHVEALDFFDAMTNDPRFQCTMHLQPGDLQFVHNHALLHDRSAWVDHPEPELRRHLYRTWMAPPSARPLPPVFAERYGSVVPGNRGGISVAGAKPVASWKPPPDHVAKKK